MKNGLITVVLIVLAICILAMPIQGNYLLYGMFNNWMHWVPVVAMVVVGFLFYAFDRQGAAFLAVFVLLSIQIFLWIGAPAMQSVELAQNLNFVPVSVPPSQSEFRHQPYVIAQHLMNTQVVDSQVGITDLDYIPTKDQWQATLNPVGTGPLFFGIPSKGYIAIDDSGVKKVELNRSWGEGAWLGGGDQWFIRNRGGYWTEWYEMFVHDNDGEKLTVVSLIGRRGFWRYPAVSQVWLIHELANGQEKIEKLTPKQASEDPRLRGVQIIPEWLVKKQVEAYSCREGLWSCLTNKERIKLQESAVNDENRPPYHMMTDMGTYWIAPVGPHTRTNLTANMFIKSDVIDNNVYVYINPNGESYPGYDSLAAFVEGSEAFTRLGYNWYRESSTTVESSTIRSSCGDKTILEASPVFRLENGGVKTYYLVTVSTAPVSNQVLWYVIIDPVLRNNEVVVYAPTANYTDIEVWLNGGQLVNTSMPTVSTQIVGEQCLPVESMDDNALSELLKRIAEAMGNFLFNK